MVIQLKFDCTVEIDNDIVDEESIKNIMFEALQAEKQLHGYYRLFSNFMQSIGYDKFKSCGVSNSSVINL